jgi:hypothetical protein
MQIVYIGVVGLSLFVVKQSSCKMWRFRFQEKVCSKLPCLTYSKSTFHNWRQQPHNMNISHKTHELYADSKTVKIFVYNAQPRLQHM